MINNELSPLKTALLVLMATSLPVINAQAQTWNYQGSYNTLTGKPDHLVDMSSSLPADLESTVMSNLPEGLAIANNRIASGYIVNDKGANLILKANANIKVSFVAEGAGYLNSVSYFKFNASELDTLSVSAINDKIIFPNFSNNVLQFGQAVDLGKFSAGDAIGFTIVANGWASSQGGVSSTKTAGAIFRTIRRLNPEVPNATNLEAHTLLYAYPEKKIMVLALEDLNRKTASENDWGITSDDDFNDVILAIHVDPFNAVDCTNCNYIRISGESGPISWREITTPPAVVDTLQQQKKAAKN